MGDYSEWLQATAARLAADGFEIRENVEEGDQKIRMVAHRSRFELTKFGNSETFFVFAEIGPATPADVQAFSTDAFQFAKRNKKSSLPCGFFESVWCYAVGLTEGLSQETGNAVEDNSPTKHWAAAEIPVVYDTGTGALAYFQKTPMWGAAYYAGFRKTIRKYLEG